MAAIEGILDMNVDFRAIKRAVPFIDRVVITEAV
jgi:hypothetical protein